MSDESQQGPKLIIDEDWKAQVQREKELAQRDKESAKTDDVAVDNSAAGTHAKEDSVPSGDNPNRGSAAASDEGKEAELADLPPATFDFLVTSLATQAMLALGQLPGPSGKPERIQKPLAKHYIDLLGVLEDKTKGNLEASEQKLLGGMLHELRMFYVRS